MSNIVENNIVLDLNRSAIQTIYAKQYDNNTREIKIEIVNQGKHVNVKSLGYAVFFKGATSTGKQLLNRCEVDNDDIVHLELTSTILHDNGHLNGEIILLDSNSGSINPETSIITGADVISTMPFILHVKSSAFEDGDISEEEYSALNDLIATVVHLEDEVEDNEEERQSNEQERISNENDRNNAENVRTSNENTRIANENTRISNENTRKSNETTRQSNEQTRQTNESTRQTNETSRIETMEQIEADLQTLENELDTVVLKRQLGVPSTSTETGVATLDTNGQVPESQLPSYVDDVLEGRAQNVTQSASGAYSATAFILKGESTACVPEEDKIYIDTTDLIQYRWSGSVFVSVGSHLALGETSSTAFPGNRGKAIEDDYLSKTGDIKDNTVTFTESSTRININSGEAISTILGKIKKFFADLKTVAFTGSYNDLTDKPTITNETSFSSAVSWYIQENNKSDTRKYFVVSTNSADKWTYRGRGTTGRGNTDKVVVFVRAGYSYSSYGFGMCALGTSEEAVTWANPTEYGAARVTSFKTERGNTLYLAVNSGTWQGDANINVYGSATIDGSTYELIPVAIPNGDTQYNAFTRLVEDILVYDMAYTHMEQKQNLIASDVLYDNTTSGISATNVQDAIDEATNKSFMNTNGTATETDMNNIVNFGTYSINPSVTTLNVPVSDTWGYVEVFKHGVSALVQLWINADNSSVYIRTKYGSPLAWSSWTAYVKTSDIANMAKTNYHNNYTASQYIGTTASRNITTNWFDAQPRQVWQGFANTNGNYYCYDGTRNTGIWDSTAAGVNTFRGNITGYSPNFCVYNSSTKQSVAVATSTWTTITSINIVAGGWYIIHVGVSFPANKDGARAINCTSSSTASSTDVKVGASPSGVTEITNCLIYSNSATTLYLRAWQNSGTSLSVNGTIQILRLK